jgi:UDP-N-acetylmuramate dehydrogenase
VTAAVSFQNLRGQVKHDEPLARYTSWRCGGHADRMYIPADRDDLAAFVAQLPPGEPVMMLGLGSNVLVRDGGVRGTVIVLHAPLNELQMRDGLIYAEAGVASPCRSIAANHDRAGSELSLDLDFDDRGDVGVEAPVCRNAEAPPGARLLLAPAGVFERRLPSDYVIGYRSVRRADTKSPEGLFTAAWFAFPPGDGQHARDRIKQLLQKRIATQPLDLPNAGSVFRIQPTIMPHV